MSHIGTQPKKVSTRQRIIDTALQLFNERRYGSVTTAMLAREVGIAEGNLWYHFNDKASLLEALSADFDAHMEARLAIRPTGDDAVGDYIALFKTMALEMARFRFFYRDQADYGVHLPNFMERIPELYRRSAVQYRCYFEHLRDKGHLTITDARLERIVVNVLIVFRHYAEFAEEAELQDQTGHAAAARAFDLHLALLCDGLTEAATARLYEAFDINRLGSDIF